MSLKHFLFIAKAVSFSALAAAMVGVIFSQTGLDRLYVGFLAGVTFAGLLAFFNGQGRGRYY